MCIGVPMRVVAATNGRTLCEGRGERVVVDTMLVGELPVGAWVLAFRGIAVRVLSPDEARATDAALDALAGALAGEGGIDAHFADLVGREPMLPDHLKGDTR